VVASCIGDSKDEASAKDVISTAAITLERPGSDRYQQDHMGLIFQQGLSFSGFERNKVFLSSRSGDGVRFDDVSDLSGADCEGDCRASVVADFDDDGDPDLFVNAIQRDCHMLFRNNTPRAEGARFLKIRLRSAEGGPDPIGAIVRVEADGSRQAQVLGCGSGFESQHAQELIFGVGEARSVDVVVRWPGRQVQSFEGLETSRRYLLVEGVEEPGSYAARTFSFADPPPRGVRVGIGGRLPELSLLDADGGARTLGSGGDLKLLINFWATTCVSCVKELRVLEKLHADGRFRVVGVSLDPASRRERIAQLWQRRSLSYESLRVVGGAADALLDLDRLAIPLSMVVSTDGRIERIVQGKLEDGDL